MSFDLDSIVWSEPLTVETSRGLRQLRTWKIPDKANAFWSEWRSGYLKSHGYTVCKYEGAWQLNEWRLIGEPTEHIEQTAPVARVPVELSFTAQMRFEEVVAIYDEIERETGEDYRYQLPAIKQQAAILESENGVLDASDTGWGKTPVACGVAKTLGRDLFVVCPKSIKRPWERMARRFRVRITVINYEMLRTGNTNLGHWHTKRKTEFVFRADALDKDSTLFVFDECHRMKDHRTKNCAMGISAWNYGYKVMGLSATAADNPIQMKFVALITGLIANHNYFFGWMLKQGVRRGRFGYEFRGGRGAMRKIHEQIFPARGWRGRIADLGDRFPQTSIESEPIELITVDRELAAQAGVNTLDPTKAINLIYKEMHKEIAKLEARERKDHWIANVLTEILRARQRCELLKVPTFVQMAQDALDENASAILMLNFDATIHACARRLSTTNTITGADKIDQRQELIDAFNADDETVVIANIKAGGLGVSLHGTRNGRTRVVLISPTYSGIDLKQALGRAWRAGGARSIQKILFAAGTIEERACEKVRAKIRRIDTLNDADLAVDTIQWSK